LFFEKLQKKIKKTTDKSLINELLKNIKRNSKITNKHFSIKKLRGENFGNRKIALVISGGPSLRKNNHIKIIKKFRKKFIIICADGSLFYLLENNIIPDLVVTLDPHKTRIVRWFGDKNLKKKDIQEDDYFKRQEIDIKFRNELKVNKKILKLTNKFGKNLKILACTSSSESVVKRVIEIKSKIYWWNPFIDNPKKKDSLSKKIFRLNKLPLINSLGNVGSACWVIAESVLGCKKIAMIGLDCAYYPGTPLKATQYYDVLTKTFGEENLKKFYKKIYNPRIKKYFFTDHVYFWYKSLLLDAIKESKAKTFNCTNGGIIYEKPVITIKLEKFVKMYLK
tara:strand:+ start:131 stop:1141 length:1011 start_codon:yes stop_codon:yes gene_type:complete